MAHEMMERIGRKLTEHLAPDHLSIADDSPRHAGHPGALGGGGHYIVTIVSSRFEGMDRIARHRLVYSILREEVGSTVHALGLTALAPSEWSAPAS